MGTVTKQQKNVPELRFPDFCDEWSKEKFQNLVKINQGLQIAISERLTQPVDGSYFYITNEFLRVGSAKKYYIKNPPPSVTCNESDVLMTRTGNTGIVVTGVAGAFHNNFFKINYPADLLNKDFLVYYLRLPATQRLILKLAGTSTIPDLNHSDFYRIELVKPKLKEQQKIADFLGSVDVWLDNLRQQKTALETYKRGMMQKIFTQQVRFKDENGNNYPDWKEEELGSVCRIRTGKKDVNQGNPNGAYPFFTCAKQHTYSDAFSFDCDAILIAGNGEVGHSQKYSGRFEAYQRTYVLSDFKVSYNYMWTVIKTLFEDYVTNQTQKGAMPYIKLGTLKSFPVPLPTEQEQEKVANLLFALDGSITAKAEEIAKAEQWKKGLMQKMFV